MAYSYRLAYASSASGETHTPTVYSDAGTALLPQPAYNVRDLGNGAYLYVTVAMPDGQGGSVVILNGSVFVATGVISPPETENTDAKTSTRAAPGDQMGISPGGAAALLDAALSSHANADSVGWALRLARAKKRVVDTTANTLTIYDLDGVTVLATLPLAPAGGPFTQVG